jgi:FkbM family methyltransferase
VNKAVHTSRSALRTARDSATRHWWVQRQVQRAAQRRLLPRNFYRSIQPVGKHSVTTPAGNTITYMARPNDAVAPHAIWPSEWERTSLDVFSQLACSARLVLDIGAYSGVYSMVALADSQADVIAVEPNPDILPNLRENLELNDESGRGQVVEAAVSDSSGVERLFVPDDPTMAAIGGPVGVEVQLVTIDDIVGDRPVDLIKMDVEGVEVAALRGGFSVLQSHRPDVIVELLTPPAFQAVAELMASAGYSGVRHLGKDGPREVTSHVRDGQNFNFHFFG